jgi:FKBP-type peptidyl-prolyl cis-trans isomerase FklB
MTRVIAMMIGLTLMLPVCWAADPVFLSTEKARDSYSLGYEFGNRLKRQGAEIDRDVLISAVEEGLAGREPALSPDEIQKTLKQLQRKMVILQNRRFEELSARNLAEGKAFLESNKAKEGVKVLPSGLQYRVLREGSGPIPRPKDWVTVLYRGTLIDGSEFDSSQRRGDPPTLPLHGMIKGWTEALQLMKTGSKWQITVPPDLAYGNRQFGRIPPNSVLVFDLELIAIAEGPAPPRGDPRAE